MVNRPKQKGTYGESLCMKYFLSQGWVMAYQPKLSGINDKGDIILSPDIVVEVKNHAGGAALGQPGDAQLKGWMRELAAEKRNSGRAIGVLVVKRKGTQNAAKFFAYISVEDFLALVGMRTSDTRPVCMDLGDLEVYLRRYTAGDYGPGSSPIHQA